MLTPDVTYIKAEVEDFENNLPLCDVCGKTYTTDYTKVIFYDQSVIPKAFIKIGRTMDRNHVILCQPCFNYLKKRASKN